MMLLAVDKGLLGGNIGAAGSVPPVLFRDTLAETDNEEALLGGGRGGTAGDAERRYSLGGIGGPELVIDPLGDLGGSAGGVKPESASISVYGGGGSS